MKCEFISRGGFRLEQELAVVLRVSPLSLLALSTFTRLEGRGGREKGERKREREVQRERKE